MSNSTIIAPGIPTWMVSQWEANMQVDANHPKCVAFLGVPVEHGFSAEGTCFFVRVAVQEMTFIYVISCRHVVRPTQSRRDLTPNNDPIWIRINKIDGTVGLVKTIRSKWIRHSDKNVDLCVYPFDARDHDPKMEFDIHVLNKDSVFFSAEYEKHYGLCLGDDLFIIGAFVGRLGDYRNIPVVRTASLAAMPIEPVWGGSPTRPAYLIETHSMGGTSGSPVFLHTTPNRIHGNTPSGYQKTETTLRTPYILIGVMQGLHSGQYAEDFVSDGDEFIVPKDADFNAGIGIALPINLVAEIIDHSDLKEARLKTYEARKKQSGHKNASARPDPDYDTSTGENPKHREDFMRLANAAARRQKQDE